LTSRKKTTLSQGRKLLLVKEENYSQSRKKTTLSQGRKLLSVKEENYSQSRKKTTLRRIVFFLD
jgi:hypothetical protein